MKPVSDVEKACIPVALSGDNARYYDIVVQSNLLERLGEACRAVLPSDARLLLLTDANVASRYLEKAEAGLKAAGFDVLPCVIPSGEDSKSLAQAQRIYEMAMEAHLGRNDAIVGLGGGVIGDLSGFCASTYHRGMRVIHVPTTLVAQVDSAIGGKTAVNVGHVKNVVGTFHQPAAVLADPNLLTSLPAREFAAGMAEVIKYGLIEHSCLGETPRNPKTPPFFEWLLATMAADALHAEATEMIHRCAAIKASVVCQDETETKGLRFYLNLGHTFGHAYESLSQYGLLHGEAVAIGMWKAVRMASRLETFPAHIESQLLTMFRHVGLLESLSQADQFEPTALLGKMKQDKKNRNAKINLILPDGEPGRVVVRNDIAEAMILDVLADNTMLPL